MWSGTWPSSTAPASGRFSFAATNLDTGQGEPVLVPCGHTLASVCPVCTERAGRLRATQCREGWHLETEPVIDPDPATDEQKLWIEKRAEAQAMRDQADAPGENTTDLDELPTIHRRHSGPGSIHR